MALADVQGVFNTIQQGKQNQLQKEQLKQQGDIAKREADLREKQLDQEHEYQQATLAAQQAYERARETQFYQSNPAVARATGSLVNQQGGTPQPIANIINKYQQQNQTVGAVPNTQETYSIPSQTAPTGPPISVTQPTQLEAAKQSGAAKALENQTLYEQQQKLEAQRATAEQNTAQIRASLDHQHDMAKAQMETESRERIEKARNIAEQLRTQTEVGGRLQEERIRQQGLYDPNRVNQAVQDLYNGNSTIEDFNKSPLSKYEKENALSGIALSGAHPINKVQSDYIGAVANLKDLIPEIKDFITNQPNVDHFGARQVLGTINAMGANQARRMDEIESGFGQLSKAIQSGVSSGRIPIFEAQKVMGLLPDPHLPADQNVQKYNLLMRELGNHINNSLSNIPQDQRGEILKTKGLDPTIFKTFADAQHMKQDKSSEAGIPKEVLDAVPEGKSFKDPDGKTYKKVNGKAVPQ